MWEFCAFRIANEAKVLDHVVDASGASLDGLAGIRNMLHPLLPRLKQVCKKCYAQGVDVGLIIADGRLGLGNLTAEAHGGCRAGVGSLAIDRRAIRRSHFGGSESIVSRVSYMAV